MGSHERATASTAGSSTARSRPVTTVQRAVAVLDALAESSQDLGTRELARRIDINASTVSRLLATLAAVDYVRRDDETGRFRLGPRLVQLGHAARARTTLRDRARPHLVALMEATGETATLSVPGELAPLTVDHVPSPASVRSTARLGRPSVIHATAIGKVFLAFGVAHGESDGSDPGGTVRRRFEEGVDSPLAAYTDRTITDPRALTAEIEATRRRGYGRAEGEREPDLNAVAAPVFGRGGALVAIVGLQGPAGRFGDAPMAAAADRLCKQAALLSDDPSDA